MEYFKMNLQLFADAGTLVNATGNYVNAGTGATTAFSGTDTLSPTMKTYYDTELLENARQRHYFAQFGRKVPLPRNRGKTVEWRKWNTLPNADKLVEGVIPTGKKMGMTYLTKEIAQYGEYVTISDQLELHAIDDAILGATEELGAAAGNTDDILVRNEVITGTSVMYAPTVSGGTETEVEFRHALDRTALITPRLINKVKTALKKSDAKPMDDGSYVALIHPSVAEDLRNHADWVEAHKYAATKEIFNGEIGELHGVRFIETSAAKVYKGDNLALNARELVVNMSGGASDATSITFDGGTVTAGALVGRSVIINGTLAEVTANTTTTMTLNEGVTCADNAVIYPGEGGAGGIAVYATVFLGKEPYGIIDPDGAGLEMIIKSKEQAGGPLNQYSTAGFKLSQATKILYEERMVRLETASSYSDTDKGN